jgi:two-component system sensor histidine kinase QseC
MMAGKSLRARLVLLTTLAVAIVWLVTAAFTWRTALHEIEELLNHPPTTASHMEDERAELAGEIAKHLLMPMAIALPGLALVLLIAVGFSLRPLQRLANDVGNRAADRLTPIDSNDTPHEIVPLIERLNELFAGIDRALQNERRFTADASHELRTPLAALKAQAQVALAAGSETERQHALEQIVAGSDRATHLLTQLLTLARLDASSGQAMHDIDLRPLAEEVLAAAAGEAIAGGCELALAEGNARVHGNSALLQSLLRNLIDNALRHGGARQIEIAIAPAGKDVVLTVADDGRGIPVSEREIVTQRFRRGASADSSDAAARSAPGSGLGLSIVSRIVELHGGRMGLDDSNSGRGLTVRIHLPGVN